MSYDNAVILILVLLLPVMFFLGFLLKKDTYKPFAIRKIEAVQGEDKRTWEFKYPFNVAENTNYIFLVDFPKGQDTQNK